MCFYLIIIFLTNCGYKTEYFEMILLSRLFIIVTIDLLPFYFRLSVLHRDFTGNSDRNSVVYHELNPPIRARFVRFVPVPWSSFIAMSDEGRTVWLRMPRYSTTLFIFLI